MNKRSTQSSTDSLELLLDTICNTFGAVLFISMLVAVLVSRSAQKPITPEPVHQTAADIADIQAELLQSKERLRILSGKLRQQKQVTSRFASEESMSLAGKIKQQTQDRVALMQQKSEAVKTITDTRGTAAVLQDELVRQQSSLDSHAATNRQLKAELVTQVQQSGRTARIPQVRRTSKSAIVYAIDNDRLHQVVTTAGTINTNDCQQSNELGGIVIRPRSGGGIALSSNSPDESIKQHFHDATPNQQFIQLFVSRDSFRSFLHVKDAMVELGLEYEVIITEDNDVRLMLGNSQRESYVQ